MSPTVDAYVHRTGKVSETRQSVARNALERMDDQLNFNLNVSTGYDGLDDSKTPDNTSRFDWIDYCEAELYLNGYLDGDDLHVLLCEIPFNAGFSTFNTGGTESDGPNYGWNDKSYRSYPWKYGFGTVSVYYGITQDWFENTVIHEAGHTFKSQHYHGMIRANSSGTYFASPMATWYVEKGCGLDTFNDKVETLCYDESGDRTACNHYEQMCSDAKNQMNTWVNDKY